MVEWASGQIKELLESQAAIRETLKEVQATLWGIYKQKPPELINIMKAAEEVKNTPFVEITPQNKGGRPKGSKNRVKRTRKRKSRTNQQV